MTPRTRTVIARLARVAGALLVLVLAAPALAQTADANAIDPDREAPSGSYFSVAFRGGLLVPLGDMEATHQQSLAAGVRLGWTSRHGVGLDLGVEYSPLSRKDALPGESFETHFAAVTIAPRLTLGKGGVRLWVSAGAGAAYDRTRLVVAGVAALTESTAAPVAVGAAGVELFPIDGLGLVVSARASQVLGDLGYQFGEVTGGLVFAFR